MILSNTLKLKDFAVFTCVVAVWVFFTPFILLCSFAFSSTMLFLLPFSFIISSSIINYPTLYKQSAIRKFIASIPWHLWFYAKPLKTFPKNTILLVHPHGLLSLGTLALIHFVPNSPTILAIAPAFFYVPIFGWFAPYLGLVPATKKGLRLTINSQANLVILPGGVPEILCTEKTNTTFFLKQRIGIFKLAFTSHRSLLPIVIQNQENTFQLIKLPLLKHRIACAWFTNVFIVFPWFGGIAGSFVPKRVKLSLKIGKLISSKHAMDFWDFKRQYVRELKKIAPSADLI